MFDLGRFIADCRAAVSADPTHKSVREIVARAVSDPSAVVAGLGEPARAKSLGPRDAEPLGRDIIHTVTNPLPRLTGAIHVYGGDFFAVARSEWDPETLLERPFDLTKNIKLFEAANRMS